MSGFDSDTATAPTDELLSCPSVTGVHVSPLSIVFQSPPPTAPKYASFGRPLTPLTAIDRPPRSGPTLRHLYELKNADSDAGSGALVDCPAPACALARNCSPADARRRRQKPQNEMRFMRRV